MTRSKTWGRTLLLAALPTSVLVLMLVPTGMGSPIGATATVHGVGPAVTHPGARWSAPMVYDAKDGYVLLFGGSTSSKVLGDTWTYKGGVWTELFPTVHPNPRETLGLVYDAKDGYVLLFGGNNGAGGNAGATIFSDTWSFSGGVWTHLHPAVHPSARYGEGMAYDAKDGYVVLFGGQGPTTMYNDTWKFVHGHWTQLSTPVAPAIRRSAGMTYDSYDGYVVLFGGLSYSDASDTWTFSAGTWTQVSPVTAPGVRVAPGMAYDGKTHHVILFGGRDDNTLSLYQDTWSYQAGSWKQLSPSLSPSARQWPGFTFDTADGYVLMFGGGSSTSVPVSVLSDTHAYAAGTWT